MRIWLRLFLTYTLVLVVGLGVLGLVVGLEMDRRYVTSTQARLTSEARVIATLLQSDFTSPQGHARLRDSARRLARDTDARVTLIAADGTVLGDSERDPRTMENHAGRTEVRAAVRGAVGRAERYSATLRVNMLYVAVPADGNGVVRLAVPLRAVAEALGRIRLLVLTTALGALALALLLSLWFAGNLGGPLGVIGRAACRFSEGDFETQVRPRGPREIAALASSFNDMAIRLRTVVRELRAEKHKIETILERLGEAIVVVDPAGRIMLANAAAARVFGAPTPQMLGLTTLEATQSHALDEAFRQALTTGETVTAEVRIRFPEGRTLEAVVAALTEAEPLGAVAILHDVTELRRLETVRREFVANASHELQTPITAIRALAETLHAGAKDDPAVADRFLADLERQADRLGTLVADLMDLAAVESGEGRLLPTPVRVADVARAVAAQLTSAAEQRGVSCELDISPELIVSADWSALRSILTNLLDNAVKYTERGGRTGIRADRRDGRIAITVWDTGIGIPSEDLPRIFERFYRVDKARSRELGGTGLGLAIVKHLAEALGGEIRVVSTLGQGSEFTVLLPAA